MKVKLLQITPNPIDIMWVAARTCYASKSPINMFMEHNTTSSFGYNTDTANIIKDPISTENIIQKDIDKKWNLVKKVLDSGHQSIAEHIYFTFAIEGISRACSHQLVRHRAGIVFSQQSQRYVEIKEDYKEIQSDLVHYNIAEGIEDYKTMEEHYMSLKQICNKYFVDVNEDNFRVFANILVRYLMDIEVGEKPEDARMLLPNATKTNIVMSCNYRQLIHMCNLRLCTRAQKEIRELFNQIVDQVKEKDEKLVKYLVPSCESLGVCLEEKSCKRKPLLKDVLKDRGL